MKLPRCFKRYRCQAYAEFAALLKSHLTAEKKVVYQATFKLTGKELHIKVAEGFVEHHLDEEEKDLMPLIRKKSTAKLDEKILSEFVALRSKTQKKKTKKNGVLKE